MAGKRKRKPIDPETRARWAEARRQLAEAIARSEERTARLRAEQARRRARRRRWTLGVLGREEEAPVPTEPLSPRQQIEALLARYEERRVRLREAEERRRARLRRWTFGLLGRERHVAG